MKTNFRRFLACLSIAGFTACEVPASSGTVEVVIQNLSSQDIDNPGRLLFAVASVNTGACVEGPCSPDPCTEDPQGKTACIGQGDASMCQCPAGSHEDTESGTGNCIPDVGCQPTTCNRAGIGTCMDEGGVVSCICVEGYTGLNCTECDAAFGQFPDGLGGCTLEPGDTCREGQGTAAFKKILADAEAELGHSASELELSSARMEEISGSAKGVRSWNYLFSEDVTLFVQAVSGFPSNAGVLTVPKEAALEPLEFDMNITRSTTSGDPQFLSGDFRIGITGPTERVASEEFGVDVKLILDFNAY